MLDRFYRWIIREAGSKKGLWALALISFSESAVLPIPVEAASIPVMLAKPERAWLAAVIAAAASVLGGAAGYAIGYFFFEALGARLLELYGFERQFQAFHHQFNEMGWGIVIIGGLTPIPYKVVSIAAGVGSLSFAVFLAASALSRLTRFLAFAAAFRWFGPRLQKWMDRHQTAVGLCVLVILAGGMGAVFLLR